MIIECGRQTTNRILPDGTLTIGFRLLENLHPAVFDARVKAAATLIKSFNGNLRIRELASDLRTNVNSLGEEFQGTSWCFPKAVCFNFPAEGGYQRLSSKSRSNRDSL
jgi:hypothetical protein